MTTRADLAAYHADMRARPRWLLTDADVEAMAAWFDAQLNVDNRSDTLTAPQRSAAVPPVVPTAAEAFHANRAVIDREARRFAARYGFEVDEVQAEAYRQFLCIYRRHRAELGDLGPRVNYLIRRRLGDYYETRPRRFNRQFVPLDDLPRAGTNWAADRRPPPYNVDDALASVEDANARLVLSLLLRPPPEIVAACCAERRPRVGNLCSAVRNHLKAAGWTSKRFYRALTYLRWWYHNVEPRCV